MRPAAVPADPKPPLNPEKPEPRVANPEDPAPDAKPVAGDFAGSVEAGDLNTDEPELPNEPKGDFSEPAKAARLDAAKADEEVAAAGFAGSPFESDPPSEPNGETVEVFANPLAAGTCPDQTISACASSPKLEET